MYLYFIPTTGQWLQFESAEEAQQYIKDLN